MGKLAGRTAIVTGAGQGIGRGVALALAREGATVCISGRTVSKLEGVADEIRAFDGTVAFTACDVTVDIDVHKMVAYTVEQFGSPSILINNAQGNNDHEHGVTLVEGTDDDFTLGAFHGGPLSSLRCMREVFPYMKERGDGRIVNFGSTTGVIGMTGFAAYGMAKEAIHALTKTAAREWGRYGITVNTVCPAASSPAAEEWAIQEPEKHAAILAQTPLGRLGDPERDIGRAIAMLVTDDMSYLTGATLMLDGGHTMLR